MRFLLIILLGAMCGVLGLMASPYLSPYVLQITAFDNSDEATSFLINFTYFVAVIFFLVGMLLGLLSPTIVRKLRPYRKTENEK